ncbi:MAG: endolytic transglycosylase MltG [Candidatus Nomurabacteria bacterium]|jgi:UPF0755 protein|nr:endolytic transglycosylase MltG [Candidatus Nomurabacteria bacterium]
MKIIALDVGSKRIGVAVADTAVKIAVPHSTVEVDGTEFTQIARIMQVEKSNHLVVGLPRNSEGEESKQSATVRSFVVALQDYFTKRKLAKPLVKFQDESLTSVKAEENLALNKRKKQRSKGEVDREAATIILQDFLDSFGSGNLEKANVEDFDVKKKSKKRGGAFKVFATIVALLIVAVVGTVVWYTEMMKAVDPGNCQGVACETTEFVVADGENTGQIAERLEKDGLIKSAFAFKMYLKLEAKGTTLRIGHYTLDTSMDVARIVQVLNDGVAAQTFKITFLPGDSMVGVRNRLIAAGFSKESVDDALTKQYDHPVMVTKPADVPLIGYVYGDTYEFYADVTAEEVLVRTFDQLYKVVQDEGLVDGYKARGLSLFEGITLASIVQKEAYKADMPQVAQIFLLRLKKGISLGSDAVIGYEADQLNPNRDKTDMSYLETIGCPWNSRKCTGLPPNPISNPGESALVSVKNPAAGDYLYFLTGDDQKMYYAKTLAEHEANIKNHCNVMCSYL